ncbi:MAG: hypothetical protein JNK60_20035 [Acidobacteria bacterium]|nr:hypothetical protein [Acidobacteriota bacterium]
MTHSGAVKTPLRSLLAAVLLLASLAEGATAAPGTPAARRDLSRDEALGGHTLSRHVGKTDAELRERLSQARISAASTYTDRETAEEAVGAALRDAQVKIERWADRQGSRPNLVVDHRSPNVLGRSLRRGARRPVDCYDALVVLRWDTRRGRWFVLTSYPEARR